MNQIDKAYAATGPPVTSELKQAILDIVRGCITPQTLSSLLWKDNVIDGNTILRASARLPNGSLILRDAADSGRILRGLKELNVIHPIKFSPGSFAPWIGLQYTDTTSLESSDLYCESYWSYRVLVDVVFDTIPEPPQPPQPQRTKHPPTPSNRLSSMSADDLKLIIAKQFPQPVENWLERFDELQCEGKELIKIMLIIAHEAYDVKRLRRELTMRPVHEMSKADIIRELFKNR